MMIALLIYLLLIVVWFGGVAVATYHVLKYRVLGDATTRALQVFLICAAVIFLFVVFFVSGLSWEVVL